MAVLDGRKRGELVILDEEVRLELIIGIYRSNKMIEIRTSSSKDISISNKSKYTPRLPIHIRVQG